MKKNFLLATFLFPLLTFGQVGVNTTNPAATLDVIAKNATGTSVEGILVPRVNRLKAQSMVGVPTSTLIYVNDVASGSQSGTAALIDAVGYYYFDGTVWTKLGAGNSAGVNIYNSDGTLTGNRIVTQNASTLAFTGTAANAFSVDASTFSVDAANHRVGIGTATPQNRFHVVTAAPVLNRYSLIDAPAGTAQAPILSLRNTSPSASGNYALLGFTNSGATSGGANWGIGTIVTATANQEDFLMANSTGSSYIDRFRITYGGNVGISTPTPQRRLHINGGIQLTNELNVGGDAATAGSAGTAGQILASAGPGAAPTWQNVSAAVGNVSWNILGNTGTNPATNFLGTTDAQPLVFRTGNTEKVRIAAGGNVGIGTANPLTTTHIVNSGAQGSLVGLVGHENNIGLRVENNVNGNAAIQHFTAKNSSGASRDAVMGINPIGTSGNGLFIIARDNASDFLMDLTSGHIGLGTDPSPTIRINMADPAGATENPIARVSNISPVAAGNKAIIGFNAYNGGGSTWGMGSEQQSTSPYDSSFNFLYSGGSNYIKFLTIKPTIASTSAAAFFGINNANPDAALDVIGNAEISGTATMANGYTVTGGATHNGNIQMNGVLTANSTAAVMQNMTSTAATLAGGVVQLRKAAAAVSGDVWMNFIANGATIGTISSNTATSIAYNTTSDIRLKENIKPTHFGIKDVMNIQVSDYNYKSDAGKTPQTGFIAQQLHTIFPVAVTKGGEDAGKNPWAVDYGKVTPLLVKAIQDQQKQIDELTAQNAKLTAAMENKTDTESKYAQLLQQVKEMQILLGIKKTQNTKHYSGK